MTRATRVSTPPSGPIKSDIVSNNKEAIEHDGRAGILYHGQVASLKCRENEGLVEALLDQLNNSIFHLDTITDRISGVVKYDDEDCSFSKEAMAENNRHILSEQLERFLFRINGINAVLEETACIIEKHLGNVRLE